MDATENDDPTDQAIDRLTVRFPTLSREHIAQIFHEEHARLDNARVHNFIPLLVEHAALERLRLEAHPEFSPPEEQGAAQGIVGDPHLDPMEIQRRTQSPDGPLLGNYGGGTSPTSR